MNPRPKPKTYESKAYRDHVRSNPCLICGKKAEFHHESGLGIGLVGGGWGLKCSDLAGIPLCHECHRLRGDQGYVTFWQKYAGLISWRGPQGDQARLIADGIVMREVIKLQMEFIEKEK